VDNAKVVIYTCPVDSNQTETKGTVLIKTAAELSEFSRGEECLLEAQIKAIADSGAKIVVSGGNIGDLALHYLNKYNLMAVRLTSKWDVRRLCKAVGATPLPKMTPPTQEELGLVDRAYVDELGDTSVVIFRMHESAKDTGISTVVVRGATENYMDDIERAVDDGVNTFKGLCRDPRLVPGGGAVEMELSRQVESFSETCEGLEQYAVKRFANALQVVPRILAENTGAKASVVISKLLAAHQEGNQSACFNIDAETESDYVEDAMEKEIFEQLLLKHWALRYATNAACTILRVDQIIMAKRGGGPKSKPQGEQDADDE
jgi:T-complex protein 1 subunit theta